ncbi:MAG: TonB-dependent receptor [Desulfomicrobium sp.]|nr:TonB-dependent receptor [Desulfomicrobium sp.]
MVGEKLITPTRQTNEQVYTGTEITRSGLDLPGAKAKISVYEAMDSLPGVQVESVDPLGLAVEQKNTRVRGVRGFLGSMTVEGVPNWGGNPMGPREYLYDMENFESIAVYKGAIPAGLGTGVGARGGAIELRPRWPEAEPGLDLDFAVGGNAYSRAHSRVDTGSLGPLGTALSLSASWTEAEKWKGPGDLGPRFNTNFMIEQPYHGDDAIEVWFNYNEVEQDLYRALGYAEVRDLHGNYRKDFNEALTGVKNQDIYHYKNNRSEHSNMDILAVVPFTFDEMFTATLKPYYSREDAEIYQGVVSQGGTVQKRIRDIERLGLLSQLDIDMDVARLSVGHLFESVDMRINTDIHDPITGAFVKHSIQTENDGNGYVNSPFATLAGTVGAFDWQAGLKYFRYDEPASKGYVPVGGVSTEAADLARDSRVYDVWLPSVGVSYAVNDMFQPYASYGRSHIRPYSYVPLINLYNSNRAAFQAAGVTLQEMFDGYDMETSDNFELGLRVTHERFDITPAIFYSKHDNLLTTVYDPRVAQSYAQNVGKATGYGLEVESNFYLTQALTLFVNPTYTRLTYDDDLSYQGNTLKADGEQVVDTPEWMVKTGLVWKVGDFECIPTVRYMGERYGDVEHKEKVGSYAVADLSVNYVNPDVSFAEGLKLSLNLYNLFNAEYVSMINASDDTREGSASYYVGAPFTAVLSVGIEF